MKKTIYTLLACVTFFALSAQKDTLKLNIDGNNITILTDDIDKLSQVDINKIMRDINKDNQALTSDFHSRVKELSNQRQQGKITQEEFEANIEMEVERYQIKMEALNDSTEIWSEEIEIIAEENEQSWEEWAEKWELEAEGMDGAVPPPPPPPFARKEERTYQFNFGNTNQKPRVKNRHTGQFDIHFGWNNLLDQNGISTNNSSELRPWQSTVFTIGGANKMRIGGNNSVFYIRYGLQYSWSHFRLKGNNTLYKNPVTDGVEFGPVSNTRPEIASLNYSSFNVAYLDLPIMLQMDFSKRHIDHGFTLGVGGYGGIRTRQRRNIEYDDFNSDPTKERTRNNYYLNQWRYGVLAQIGFGSFKITGKYDLSQLFREDKASPDLQVGSITFGFAIH